jgi:hypothetical protein
MVLTPKLKEKVALVVRMDAQMVEHTAAAEAIEIHHLLTVVARAEQSVSFGPALPAHSHLLVQETCK